ncbi:MAG TPA: non-heme iron oxygenase ferredoxin subunit [Segeticoccus sp.]|nr:non-heme iron oxygenase ferredoxin subunit [Segeticoccus sp.]
MSDAATQQQAAGTFVPVCTLSDIPDVGGLCVDVEGHLIAIARDSAGSVHAIDDTCTHENVSLSEGEVEDGEIECWLHGSRFDLTTGKPTSLPATRPVNVYPVKIEGEDVLISLSKEN